MNLFGRKKTVETPPAPFAAEIRWMLRNDLAAVLDIEQLCFRSPWTQYDFEKTLAGRNVDGLVACDKGSRRVLGYAVYKSGVPRVELLNLAVLPAVQRRGLGRQFLDQHLKPMLGPRRRAIKLIISERNIDGQLFFKAQGFRAEAVLPRAFKNSDDDGYLMTYRAGRVDAEDRPW